MLLDLPEVAQIKFFSEEQTTHVVVDEVWRISTIMSKHPKISFYKNSLRENIEKIYREMQKPLNFYAKAYKIVTEEKVTEPDLVEITSEMLRITLEMVQEQQIYTDSI